MGVEINGPKILFNLFDTIPVTESIVNSWLVIAVVFAACVYLTRNLTVTSPSTRQVVAEKLVEAVNGMVNNMMGERFRAFAPYIAALFAYSFCSSIMSVTSLRSPTADFSVTLGMALITFVIMQFLNLKTKGPIGFFTRFSKPVAVMTPLNILSELATPVSLSLRHFGNIAAGLVITGLLYGALAALSSFVLGWIPITFISNIPLFQLGIPAFLSLYFDLFTSALQAYIFCTLTMVYVSGAAES